MSELPLFESGTDLVIEERWQGWLWSAVPHRVIHSRPDLLVAWVPAGSFSVYATNRGLPETVGLTRDQRKLLALKTLKARACEFAETPSKLSVYRPDRWSHINLGFDPDDGHFLGWYVDFQLPPQPTSTGLATKDLVLDLWVNPDRSWAWKDCDDLEEAIAQGLVDASYRGHLDHEADRVLSELAESRTPFTDALIEFQPDPRWPLPALPRSHAWKGTAWSLPPGWRASTSPG